MMASVMEQRDAEIRNLRKGGATYGFLAQSFGVSAARIKEICDHIPTPKAQKIHRKCLNCQRAFEAQTRFIRLCEGCK
jgi:hypothetical protein